MPRFGINPGLLQQLASGGGFQPGQAMLQGLAYGQEQKQNAMTNQLNQRKLQLQEKRIGLSEKQLENELAEQQRKANERIRKRMAEEDMLQDVQSRADISEDAKQTFTNILRTEGPESANKYLLSLDDQSEELETFAAKEAIKARFKDTDKGDMVEVWDRESGESLGQWFEGELPDRFMGNPSVGMNRIGKPEGSMSDIGRSNVPERTVARDEHRAGLQRAASQLSTVTTALNDWERASDAGGMQGVIVENVGGVVGQVFGKDSEDAFANMMGASSPEAVTKYRQDFQALIAKNVPEYTGEEGARISDKELKIAQIATRLKEITASDTQMRTALENMVNLSLQAQEGHKVALGRGKSFDLQSEEGKRRFAEEMKRRGVRKENARRYMQEMENWYLELESIGG